MNILHLCPSFPYSKLYRDLVASLDRFNIKQFIYVPVRKDEEYSESIYDGLRNAHIKYSKVFNNIDRLFYTHKISKIFCDIENKVDFKNIDLVHAHYLFSMGGIALKLKKEKNIDYIVAVRNTDINVFFKYMIHTRKIGVQIMKEAKKIVFINPVYKEFVINRYIPCELRDYVNQKSIIVPNGVNHFWLKNKAKKYGWNNKKQINLIYVGDFSKNKNIMTSINVAKKLKKLGYNIHFSIIGSLGKGEYMIKQFARKNKDIINIYPRIEDKENLLDMYRKSDIFLMPSFHETFGLVYLEAMSQGLPLIYSKGQGIDGYFKDGNVGYSVNPRSIDDIVEKIEMIIDNYDKISENCYNSVEKFSWDEISKIYHKIYISAI